LLIAAGPAYSMSILNRASCSTPFGMRPPKVPLVSPQSHLDKLLRILRMQEFGPASRHMNLPFTVPPCDEWALPHTLAAYDKLCRTDLVVSTK
jgi:hypothetical protein